MCFLLCGTRSGSSAYPFQFYTKYRLALSFSCQLHFLTLGFQFQVSRIICLVTINQTFIDFNNSVRHAIQKVAVMGYHDECPSPLFQIVFQPICHFIIQMVCRLIKQKYVCRGKQYRNECKSFSLPSG